MNKNLVKIFFILFTLSIVSPLFSQDTSVIKMRRGTQYYFIDGFKVYQKLTKGDSIKILQDVVEKLNGKWTSATDKYIWEYKLNKKTFSGYLFNLDVILAAPFVSLKFLNGQIKLINSRSMGSTFVVESTSNIRIVDNELTIDENIYHRFKNSGKIEKYKESIATIIENSEYSSNNSLAATLILGSPVNTNGVKWMNYSFEVNGKKLYGEATSGWQIGEKFIVKYDPTKNDNDHSFLVYFRPIFLDNEKTVVTKGKIIKVHGRDRINNGIGVQIQYYIPEVNLKGDTTQVLFSRYQFLSPELNVDDIKSKMSLEYKLKYSFENPKRAILYYAKP